MSIKAIQPELIHDSNYLSLENGCQVVFCSSQDPRALSQNIINSEQKVWMTQNTLPQQCIISTQNMKQKPQQINVIGFYCWHQFDSNPSLIQVYCKIYQSRDWKLLGKFRLKHIDGWQYFMTDSINPNNLIQLKVRLCQSFGNKKAYINQVALHSINMHSYVPTVRESRSSTLQQKSNNADFMKYISPPLPNDIKDKNKVIIDRLIKTQKQLDKAQTKISKLTQQQNIMKSTILKQGNIIIQLEQKLKAVISHMQKLSIIQSNTQGHKYLSTPQIDSYNKYHTHSDQQNDFSTQNKKSRNYQHNQVKLKKMLDMFQQQVNGGPMMKKKHQNSHKYHTVEAKKPKHKKNQQHINYDNEVIRINSDQNFSQYSPNRMFSTHQNHIIRENHPKSKANSTTKNKQQLKNKIQLLLKLKEQKKSQLSAKKSRTNMWSAHQSYSPESQNDHEHIDYAKEIDDSIDEQYFRKIRQRKVKANGY